MGHTYQRLSLLWRIVNTVGRSSLYVTDVTVMLISVFEYYWYFYYLLFCYFVTIKEYDKGILDINQLMKMKAATVVSLIATYLHISMW